MHKKFEINQVKIKGGCQWGRNVATHNSKSDLYVKSMNELRASVAEPANGSGK